ncbi:hypothetical protein MN116_002378 [Schistosoma mekongi]|uniref:UBX domain-containing protein 4 n=1 Tax=Schistosoma mekongi TaxID=38744 RepID=A0AAE1ZJL8_SCHME|nr:hypothetical protein MN116_002378 [Schistosoma mekongi]
MEWFKGEVSDAVKSVKEESKVLLVFIKGTDEESSFVSSQFNDQVGRVCQNVICLQLDASSHAALQFSAVYAVLTVPCIYLISHTGQVIDVKLGRLESNDLIDWIKKSEGGPIKHEPSTTPGDASNIGLHDDKEKSVITDSTELPVPSTSATRIVNCEQPLEERVQSAYQLIHTRRQQKDEECRKASTEAEMKRRELGKALSEYKERQKQKEVDEAISERRKEQIESRLQLERLCQQIEEDRKAREERWLRINGSPPVTPDGPVNVTQEFPNSQSYSDEVRLQLKSLEGGYVLHRFPATATISGDVRNWLHEMVSCDFQMDDNFQTLGETERNNFRNLILKGFRFLQLHPKRILEPEDESQSLKELGYCPSAALFLVSNKPNQAITRSNGGIVSQFYYIISSGFSNTYCLISWAVGGLYSFGQNLVSSLVGSRTQQSNTNSTQDSVNRNNSVRNHSVRRQGNIARLSHMPDSSDDEQARWNGNSTEQL